MKVRVTMKISEKNFRSMEYQSWNPPRDDLVRGTPIKDNNKAGNNVYAQNIRAQISAPRYVESFNLHISPLKVQYYYPIFTDKDTEASRHLKDKPRSLKHCRAEPGESKDLLWIVRGSRSDSN